ncbi:MAG: hypothetical protein Q4B54_14905, partial [Coriobacteriales bacterium]|nr:hypothetical protein [Coriobacteriales bacterium]
GIAEFEAANRSLAQLLLSDGALTEADKDMLDYFLDSGVYGTLEHRVENAMSANGWGKIRYALNRFFVPMSKKNKNYAAYEGSYPFFYKHKILLPLLPFYRTVRYMRAGRIRAEAEAIKRARKRTVQSLRQS